MNDEGGTFDRHSVQTASKKRRQFRSSGADRHIQLPVARLYFFNRSRLNVLLDNTPDVWQSFVSRLTKTLFLFVDLKQHNKLNKNWPNYIRN